MSTTEQQKPAGTFDPTETMQIYADIARKSGALLTRAMQKAGAIRKRHLTMSWASRALFSMRG